MLVCRSWPLLRAFTPCSFLGWLIYPLQFDVSILQTHTIISLSAKSSLFNQSTWPSVQHTCFNCAIPLIPFAVWTHPKTVLRMISKTILETIRRNNSQCEWSVSSMHCCWSCCSFFFWISNSSNVDGGHTVEFHHSLFLDGYGMSHALCAKWGYASRNRIPLSQIHHFLSLRKL